AAAAQNIKKIALVVNYLRKMGLNMAEIRQILASVYPCNEWKLLRTIYKKKSRSRPTVASKKEPHLKSGVRHQSEITT
ncbi:hypothetical protein CIK04_19530, partial [Vibrio sp. 03_296]|uniref:hypothetical protein n=1 Tax=Vibrio sp. 03_296 TaxID=2024409 RepID=UPI000BCBCF31